MPARIWMRPAMPAATNMDTPLNSSDGPRCKL
eukprot:CAMPEP_0198507204 /NCGR_PEP_ID=MMETSP1462-20131121/12171_1 /TAXON_ID=1333877 /ORGANISM="Brandtodinium nutriculum, Strain RCC3387" /LENGTH=31 /DNA_ID= /DNA_START= /DNA_END= /DNA_ORIENTATION=